MLLLEHRHRIVDRIRHAVVARAPVMIHQQIPRHAGEPCGKRSIRRPVTRERPIDAQEDILAQILRVGGVSREAIAYVVYAPRVPAHEFLPGRPFAPETLLYQLSVGLQSSSASRVGSPFGPQSWNAKWGRKVPHRRDAS